MFNSFIQNLPQQQQQPTFYNTFVQPQQSVQAPAQNGGQLQSTAPSNYYGMQGWDTGKLNQGDYHSEKYDLGRAIQTLLGQGVNIGRGNLDPLVDYMKKTYGNKYNISSFGKDDELKLTGGNIVDLVHGGDDAWQFLDQGVPGQMQSTMPQMGAGGFGYNGNTGFTGGMQHTMGQDPMQWRRDNYMRQHQRPIYNGGSMNGGNAQQSWISDGTVSNGWGGTFPKGTDITGYGKTWFS